MDDNQELLESILVVQVLLLARDLARERQHKGAIRVGGNHYREEAVRMLRRERRSVLEALNVPD